MSELDIIKQIEEILNVKLEKLSEFKWNSKGYILNRNREVTGLGLSDCKIRNLNRIISPLKDLTNLTGLHLSSNQLSDISLLKDLKNLTELKLSINQLSDISPLKALTNLTELNLGNNQLSDISPLKALTNLTVINLSTNKLSDISPLKDLNNLTELNLDATETSDISPLKDLTYLTNLNLSFNRELSDISPIADLINLKELIFQANDKIKDIASLKQLKKLSKLILWDISIEKLPPWITDFNMNIQWSGNDKDGYITLHSNPLKIPPIEIVKQGKEAVRDYFKSLEEKEKVVKLNEVRILLVGDGMAGKTSLLKQIKGGKFDKDESQTHGINVVTSSANNIRRLKNIKKIKDCQLHFWDFGGQEIMHATHQFFLSERSLYLLVLDSRTDSKKHYWFKHIEKYGGDSPLIVVMNKVDENPNYNIEQKKINDGFPNIENRFFRVSCKTQEGIPGFLACLGKTIPKTSLFGTDINIDWMNIKDRLVKETQDNNYISRGEFIKICKENNVDDESSQLTLLKFLHDLGVVLYFEKLKFKSIFVLDPHWVTIGVYKIINSAKTKDGILKEQDLDYILNKEKIKKEEYDPAKEKKINYSLEEQRYIVDIMMQFELCYEYDQKKNYYIIPDLLTKELKNEPELNEGAPLHFVMKYDYLPSPVISRLMIRFKNDIIKGQQWKYGMMLENDEFKCKAKIKSDEQNKTIEITVQGELRHKREYFAVIRHHLNDINKGFENLKIEELIPLPGHPDILVEYKELLGYERSGRDEYFVGKLGKSFSVSEMLDSVISKNDRMKHYSQRPEDTSQDKKIEVDSSNLTNIRDKVFVSYSHKDKHWFEKVQTHLKVLEGEGISINLWADTKIKSGMKWYDEITKALSTAKVAILLVSTDFLASDFIGKDEIPQLLKAAKNDGATILPLILKPCRFSKNKKLSEFQAVNDPDKPLSGLPKSKQDKILLKLTDRIDELMNPKDTSK
jgi:small GTP-binding protein